MAKKKVRIYKAPNGKGDYKSKLKNFLYIAQQGAAVQSQQLSKAAENQLLEYITDSIEIEGSEVEVIYQSLLEQGMNPQQAQFYIGIAMEDINLTKAENKSKEDSSQVDDTPEMIQAQLDEEERLNEEAMDKAQIEQITREGIEEDFESDNELFFTDTEEVTEQTPPEGPLQEDGSFKLGGEKDYIKRGLKNFIYAPGGEEVNNQTPGAVNQEVGKREIQRNNLVNYSQSNVAKKEEEERLKAEYANMIAAQQQQMYNAPMEEETIDITNMQEGMEYARLGSAGSQRRLLRKAMKPMKQMMKRGIMPGVTHMDVRKSGLFGPKEYSLDFDPNMYAQMMSPYFTQLAGMMGGMSGGFPGFPGVQSRKTTKRYPIVDAAKTVNKENTKSDKELEEGYMSEDPMPMETKRNYLIRTGRGDQIKFFSEEDLKTTWDDQYIDPINRGSASASPDGQTGEWMIQAGGFADSSNPDLTKFIYGGDEDMYREGGFPDLNNDGKLSYADILKGRGVFQDGGEKLDQYQGPDKSIVGPVGDNTTVVNPFKKFKPASEIIANIEERKLIDKIADDPAGHIAIPHPSADTLRLYYGQNAYTKDYPGLFGMLSTDQFSNIKESLNRPGAVYHEGVYNDPDSTYFDRILKKDVPKGRREGYNPKQDGGEMEDIPMAQRGLFGRGIGNLFSNINPISRFAGYRPTSGYYNRGTGMPFAMSSGANPYVKNVDVTKSRFGRPSKYSVTYGYGNNTGSAPRQEIKLNDSQYATVDTPEEQDSGSAFQRRSDRRANRLMSKYDKKDAKKYERNRRRSIKQGMGDPGSYEDDQARADADNLAYDEEMRKEQEAIDNYVDPIIGANEEAVLLADDPNDLDLNAPVADPYASEITRMSNRPMTPIGNQEIRLGNKVTNNQPISSMMSMRGPSSIPTRDRDPELQRFTNQRATPSNTTQMGLMEQGVNAAMDYYKNNPNMRPAPSNTSELGLIEQGVNAAQQFGKGDPIFATEQPDWAKAYGGPIVGDEVEMTEEELERFILGGGVVEYM